MRDVRLPTPCAVLSSARYRTHIFPSFTAAAGLNVSLSSHLTRRLCIGHSNSDFGLGLMTGLTPAGRTKPPSAHFGSGFSAARTTSAARQTPANAANRLMFSMTSSFRVLRYSRCAVSFTHLEHELAARHDVGVPDDESLERPAATAIVASFIYAPPDSLNMARRTPPLRAFSPACRSS